MLLRRHVANLERLVAGGGVRIVLYVNQNPKIVQMMRHGRVWQPDERSSAEQCFMNPGAARPCGAPCARR